MKEMSRTVIKFGGSDLKTSEDIKRIIAIVKKYDRKVALVFSAFYGITDRLIEALLAAEKGTLDVENVVNNIAKKKQRILEENISDTSAQKEACKKMFILIDELKDYLKAISYVHDIPAPSGALILSYGERLSTLCMTEILKNNGLDVILRLPEDLKLITDGEFRDATVDFDKSAVKENMPDNTVVTIPGYYGVSQEGKTTLLGRGGSDYSAAAIAYCIDSPSLDLWKDVKGFMSGDPKLVENAQCIKKLAYNEAAELAYFGAKILHPRTVEPLKEKNIPVNLFSINGDIDTLVPATVISHQTDESRVIKSVTYSKAFGVLKLKGSGLGIKPGVLADITNLLHQNNININSVLTSQIAINIILNKEDLIPAKALIEKQQINVLEDIELLQNISLVAVVGEKIMENYGISSRIFSAITSKKINVKMNCTGASPIVSYFIIDEKDMKMAIQAIHSELFN